MGKTLPPFSQLIEYERRRWAPLKPALPKEDHAIVDRLFDCTKLHTQAGVMMSRPWPFESIIMAIFLSRVCWMNFTGKATPNGLLTGIWRLLSSAPCRPPVPSDSLDPAKAHPPRPPARRSGDRPVARRDVARDQKGAEAQQQTLFFIDESGFYPLPGVTRTYAPVGQTPIVREWWTRDQLSAISAISPEGKLYFHSQDRAINADDGVGFLAHPLREVPGRIVIIWDGAPLHRRHVVRQFLADGASQRLHLARLPAYAPELHPGEGLWAQLKGVERCNVGCFNIPPLRHELRAAVKRVRRTPRLLQSFFRGAKL